MILIQFSKKCLVYLLILLIYKYLQDKSISENVAKIKKVAATIYDLR